MHRRRLIVTLGLCTTVSLLTALSMTAVADGDPPSSGVESQDVQELLQGIDGMRRLPVQGIQMVQAGERVFFVSLNGRYAFLGPAIDLWHGEQLHALADADRLMGRIDPRRLRLEARDLGALDLGTGPREVLVFVDPQCPQCRALLDVLQRLGPSLLADYRFRLIPVGVLGKESIDQVVRLNCLAESDPKGAREILLRHRFETLPAPSGACGQGALQRALVTAQLLGLTQVPFLIAPDGRLHSGVPADLPAWLNGDAL